MLIGCSWCSCVCDRSWWCCCCGCFESEQWCKLRPQLGPDIGRLWLNIISSVGEMEYEEWTGDRLDTTMVRRRYLVKFGNFLRNTNTKSLLIRLLIFSILFVLLLVAKGLCLLPIMHCKQLWEIPVSNKLLYKHNILSNGCEMKLCNINLRYVER